MRDTEPNTYQAARVVPLSCDQQRAVVASLWNLSQENAQVPLSQCSSEEPGVCWEPRSGRPYPVSSREQGRHGKV